MEMIVKKDSGNRYVVHCDLFDFPAAVSAKSMLGAVITVLCGRRFRVIAAEDEWDPSVGRVFQVAEDDRPIKILTSLEDDDMPEDVRHAYLEGDLSAAGMYKLLRSENKYLYATAGGILFDEPYYKDFQDA